MATFLTGDDVTISICWRTDHSLLPSNFSRLSLLHSGNFFTADCGYVRTLLTPTQFVGKMETTHHARNALMRSKNRFVTIFASDNDVTLGVNGYAMEHWIASSPDVRPCDLSPSHDMKAWFRDPPTASFQFQMQPRFPSRLKQPELRKNRSLRLKEYFLLSGFLFKWFKLYHRAPPPDSWIWDWYPDGADWKDAVGKFGDSALEIMIEEGERDSTGGLSEPDGKVSTGSTSQGAVSSRQETAAEITVPSSDHPYNFKPASPTMVLFYNIYIPPNQDNSRALGIIEEQMDQIGASHVTKVTSSTQPVVLYYNTLGSDSLDTHWMQEICRRNKLECRHMQHYDNGFEEVTLQRVTEFCQVYPHHKVTYIHSIGSYHSPMVMDESVSQDAWRRNLMNAVTSQLCIEPANDQCNVCGLLALPLPSLHFPGNFFTAQCSYINKLLPINEFSQRMRQVVSSAQLESTTSKRYEFTLLDDSSSNLGVGRFASDHWIGSHPSVQVCDLSAKPHLLEWQTKDRSLQDFAFAMFPRRPIDDKSAVWPHTEQLDKQLEKNPLRRFREYFLLAGNVFKWFALYKEVPPYDSWVWKWYPSGKAWRSAVKSNGQDAFKDLTEEMAARISSREKAKQDSRQSSTTKRRRLLRR